MARDARGSATVEFALVLPLLLIVCLALVQVGILVRDQLVLVSAARAAAREAAVTDREEDVRRAMEEAAATIDASRVEMSVSREGGQGGSVAVELRYAGQVSVPFVAWLFPDSIPMSGRATMRQEFG